jgi:hypothetical protein
MKNDGGLFSETTRIELRSIPCDAIGTRDTSEVLT